MVASFAAPRRRSRRSRRSLLVPVALAAMLCYGCDRRRNTAGTTTAHPLRFVAAWSPPDAAPTSGTGPQPWRRRRATRDSASVPPVGAVPPVARRTSTNTRRSAAVLRSSSSSLQAAGNDERLPESSPTATTRSSNHNHKNTSKRKNNGGKTKKKYKNRNNKHKNNRKGGSKRKNNRQRKGGHGSNGSNAPVSKAGTVSELVQNVRAIMTTRPRRHEASSGGRRQQQQQRGPSTDWRTAWSILKKEATVTHQTVLASPPQSQQQQNDDDDDHTTVLPVRVYHEVLECMKKEHRCWQDAIRLVQYMESGSRDDETESETENNDKDNDATGVVVDKYNSRPWYIPTPNYEIYHTVIECCCNNGGGRKDAHDASVYWLSKMLRKLEDDLKRAAGDDNDVADSDAPTITNRDRKLVRNSIQLVLGSLSKQRKWRDALQLLEYMEILSRPGGANIPLTVVQYNTVLTCLARSKQVGQCQRLLQRLQAKSREELGNQKNKSTTNSNSNNAESGAARPGGAAAAASVLHPDEISYNAVISACASAGKWREALKILDECYEEPGVEPNIYIYTNAMRACAKGGNTQRALDLLRVVKDKGLPVDSYCYTAVIDACAKGKQWKKALELFDEMEAKGIKPTQVTYSVTISALGNGLQWERALWLLNLMRDKGMSVNLYTYNAAITALAKSSKNRHSAKLSLSSSSDGSTETDDLQQEELWPKALDLLRQMDQDGIEPDGFCYSSAINCCGAEGQWEEACDLIEIMKRGGPKSRPNKIAYTAAISACGRAGQSSKALELFQGMRDDGLAADRVAYNALFSALRVSKDADRAYELWGEICGRRRSTETSIATARDIASPDIITLTDCIATLSRAGYTRQMDEVFREAVERGIVLGGSNDLDRQWEIDLSGLPFPIARAATRYLLQSISQKQQSGVAGEDNNEPNVLQDMIFITGTGKAQQKRREERESSPTTVGAAAAAASNNVLEKKDRTTSLRDFVQGILETDFDPPLESVVPSRAQGTVVVEVATLARWLNEKEGKVLLSSGRTDQTNAL